ncbi:MAG TPA: helix-turn-helix transcriptional regulator [Allosphingosinicella sp.]|nr:helix-turn-helix transcriptional regulator [Allosphingosinicella sp.]
MPKTIFSGANQVVVEALRQVRRDAGLTQKQLADRVHRDQSWVSLIEGSQRRVDVVEFIDIARAMGVDPSELLTQIAEKMPPSRPG